MGNKLPSGPIPDRVDKDSEAKGSSLTAEYVAKLERDKATHVSQKIDTQAANTDAATVGQTDSEMETLPS